MNYRKELTENILPFWLENALDMQRGGIYTQLDREGKVYGREKSVWFQGRALWTFSKAYNVIEKDEQYLRAAKCIYDFLPTCTDTDGRMFFTVTEVGKEIQKRRYFFSETFAAIGCAEYYKATGDTEALRRAETYFDVAYECFTGKRPTAPKTNPQNQPLKTLSPVMIMLATAQTMRSLNSARKAEYDAIVRQSLDEILHGGFLRENALLENVTTDGKFFDTPSGRIVNPGHSLEAAWFIMAEGLVQNDRAIIDYGKKIIDITLPLGLDAEHGGIIAFTDVDGKPPVQLEWDMKLWWPQCEAMIALRLASLIYHDENYQKQYESLKEYCKNCFIDKECGEWFGYLHYDNTVSTTLKGNIFKGPFHIPRLYIIMALLDEGSFDII